LGDPNYGLSFKIIKELIDAGADALELGFAFSDPIADGPTIQEADQRALRAGANTEKNFELLKKIRSYNNEIPISLLIYYNLICQFGLEKFYKKAKAVGVDAILASDVSFEEAAPLLKAAEKHGVNPVFLVTPLTAGKRLKKILEKSSGYVYLVSLLGVTGARKGLQKRTFQLIKRVKRFTKLPLIVGFGISKPEHVKQVIEAGADGAIVGSAIVDLIKKNLKNEKKLLKELKNFALKLKKATL